MYIAAGRIYRRYGLSAIGIPYQYGLVRCCAASDLPEGMLNNSDRPEIVCADSGEAINPGKPIVHFNARSLLIRAFLHAGGAAPIAVMPCSACSWWKQPI